MTKSNTTGSEVGGSAELPRLITVREAAYVLNLSEKAIRNRVSDGTIPHRKSGGALRFHLDELLEWTIPGHGERRRAQRSPVLHSDGGGSPLCGLPSGRLAPSGEPVTCRRCLRRNEPATSQY